MKPCLPVLKSCKEHASVGLRDVASQQPAKYATDSHTIAASACTLGLDNMSLISFNWERLVSKTKAFLRINDNKIESFLARKIIATIASKSFTLHSDVICLNLALDLQ